jgi:hypothetical protein
MPYNGAVAHPQFASYELADDPAEPSGETDGNSATRKQYVLSDYPDSDCYVGGCCPQHRVWADFEVLWWWREGRRLPPLVTSSTNPPPPPDQAGTLGNTQTFVLFGGDRVTESPHFGARCEIGLWVDRCATWGIAASAFSAGEESQGFFAQSDGDPVLARPFFNTTTAMPAALLVAYPGLGGPGTLGPGSVTGSIEIFADNEIIGGEIFLRKKLNHYFLGECVGFLMEGPAWLGSVFHPFGRRAYGAMAYDLTHGPRRFRISRIDLIGGYQYTRIRDSLMINNRLVNRDPTGLTPVDTVTDAQDYFYCLNEFHGGTLGLICEVESGPWKVEALGKLGIGNTHVNTQIAGQHQFTPPGGPPGPVLPGALLAQPTNIGNYTDDYFTLVPEARLQLQYQVNCHLDFTLGYTVMWWNHVALAGDQVNLNLSGATLPPIGPDPQFTGINPTAFWAQGIDLGLRLRF